jgi:predicted molibdopterin-dependent oxidoreductase YjgC
MSRKSSKGSIISSQQIFLTKTAQMAHVVLPATATWAEGGHGHE